MDSFVCDGVNEFIHSSAIGIERDDWLFDTPDTGITDSHEVTKPVVCDTVALSTRFFGLLGTIAIWCFCVIKVEISYGLSS
jgi:hypothetical protein